MFLFLQRVLFAFFAICFLLAFQSSFSCGPYLRMLMDDYFCMLATMMEVFTFSKWYFNASEPWVNATVYLNTLSPTYELCCQGGHLFHILAEKFLK